MNKILINVIISVLIVILVIIVIIKSLQYKSVNNFYVDLISPLNYIKYNEFKQQHKIVKQNIPIYIFYHLCPKSKNNTDHIVIIDEQINDLIVSGLYSKCEQIFYGCSCENCDIFLDNYLNKYSKFKKLDKAIVPNLMCYENITMNSMIEFAKNSKTEFYGLYFHTKGTTSVSEYQHHWRQFMSYFLIKNHTLCVDILNRGFNTCGVDYIEFYKKHYAGNFFWFSSNYVKKLDYITKIIDNRFEAEFVLLSKYEKNKHVSIYKERFFSLPNSFINVGLYNFKVDLNHLPKNYIQNADIAIV